MAVDPAKIREMMRGRTLDKDNIKTMYDMVGKAETADEKKRVMKHSVFLVGQLPLLADYVIDVDRTRKLLLASVPRKDIDTYMTWLLEGLATQKLIMKKSDEIWQVNTRYEDAVAKAGKVARAYQADQEAALEGNLEQVKKLYQTGTKHYNSKNYEEAAECFKKAADLGQYRMAYYSLATMYSEGKGVEKNKDTALYYACKALMRGARIAEALVDELDKE